jgi:lipid-binding SYLF domain-containing protein
MAILFFSSAALAQTREERLVADAADVVDQLLRIPEQTIPPNLLSRAYAIAVIPNVLKVGFVAGARHGKGVLVVRQDDDSWSNPAFIKLTGGSVGWQVGAQSTDLILVFKRRQYVDDIANGKITLGADASVAAGPVGRYTSAAIDLALKAEVVSYSRSRGLFAGIALEGAGISMDRKANAAFYSSASMTPQRVFESSPTIAPPIANEFVQLLTRQTSRLPTQPGMQAGPSSFEPADAATADEPSVTTYGLPDPDEDY